MSKLAPYWKAIAGFIAPGVALFAKDSLDGSLPNHHQWVTILVACVVGAIGVYAAPKNAPVTKGEEGNADVGFILLVLTFVGVVLLLCGVRFN